MSTADVLRDYITRGTIPKSYKVPAQMHRDGLVPRSYIQTRVATVSAYTNHKLGANRAVEETIQAMIANGWLMEVKHDKVVEGYNHHGRTYRILDLPDYHSQSEKEK